MQVERENVGGDTRGRCRVLHGGVSDVRDEQGGFCERDGTERQNLGVLPAKFDSGETVPAALHQRGGLEDPFREEMGSARGEKVQVRSSGDSGPRTENFSNKSGGTHDSSSHHHITFLLYLT